MGIMQGGRCPTLRLASPPRTLPRPPGWPGSSRTPYISCMSDSRPRGRRSGSSARSAPSARSAASGSATASPTAKKAGSSSRRRRHRGAYTEEVRPQLTSLPTHRGAYQDTRAWLLETHGPICAYCARECDARKITLDHVTPRRGQSAYDRRDNLVLACSHCNAYKADRPLLAFLLAKRERAANLLRYGLHLSPMLVELATQVAGPEAAARAVRLADPDYPYSD